MTPDHDMEHTVLEFLHKEDSTMSFEEAKAIVRMIYADLFKSSAACWRLVQTRA